MVLIAGVPLVLRAMAGNGRTNAECGTRNAEYGGGDGARRGDHSGTEPSDAKDHGGDSRGSLAVRLDRSPWVRLGIGLFGLVVLGVQAVDKGWDAVTLNFVNLAFLSAGLLLHPNIVSYVSAVAEGGRAVTGIVLQFPLYGGIESVISGAGIAAAISQRFIDASGWVSTAMGVGPTVTLPLATLASAAVVNVFIPSGGGQWMVQGPIMCSAAAALDVPLPQTVMAVAYGDQLTNMIQPFWAVPLMGLTAVDPRRFMGYCALLMILAAPAFAVTLILF
jgi:short-chain fatty acids transporter